jgi:uncharacterized protein YecE (DUF72 family)
MAMQAEFRAGTSGWTYGGWRGRFYPEALKPSDYLAWYARRFDTVEVNSSFYHLPQPKRFEKWAAGTPERFVFAVKVSKIVTHTRRLEDVEEPWRKFLDHAAHLGGKLGPLLLQFPPSFRADRERLERFLERSAALGASRLALEFRHASWFTREVDELAAKHGAALVIGHSSRYPCAPLETAAPFLYLRFHGPRELFASRYSEQELTAWAARIRSWLTQGRPVYAYFNNDACGYAIENAEMLIRLAKRLPRRANPAGFTA